MNKHALHANILGSVRFNEVKATRTSKINYGFNAQNNNFERASLFSVHFFAVFAWLRRENAQFRVLWWM